MADGDFTGTATPSGYYSGSMPPPLFSSKPRHIVHFDMTHDEGWGWAYFVIYHGRMYLRRGHEGKSPFRGARYLEEFAQGRERVRHRQSVSGVAFCDLGMG